METGFLAAPISAGGMGDMKTSSNFIKPWTCARANIFVKPTGRNTKGRYKKLKSDKLVMENGLTKAPYVMVE